QVRRQRSPLRVQEIGGHDPAHHRSHERWEEQEDEDNAKGPRHLVSRNENEDVFVSRKQSERKPCVSVRHYPGRLRGRSNFKLQTSSFKLKTYGLWLTAYDSKLFASYERKRTSSRWNILTARTSAAAAYTHVDAKMTAMEFQW